MNKKELQTLTIEQLNGMTEQALKAVAEIGRASCRERV